MKTSDHLSDAKRQLLEKYAGGRLAQEAPDPDAITSRPSDGGAPLSVAQEGFWLQEKSSADIRRLYNESISLRMKGALDIGVLERSFAEILRRHEIWRTTYAMREGRLVQIVHPPAKVFAFSIQDFRGLPESEQTKEIRKFRDEQTQEPLDLEQGPLLRASLLRVSAEENLLFVVAHLSIVDGVSVYQILPTELAVLYEAYSAGRESPLAELPVQFSDFAYWQREHLDRGRWETQRAFWRARLTGELPVLNWPRDRARAGTETFRGTTRSFSFSPDATERIKLLGHREGVTLFVTLLAGFAALLHRYSNQTDIIIGTPSPSGRQRPEIQKLMGHFINPVTLRLNLKDVGTFRDLLHHAREITSEAMMHDAVPIETLMAEILGPSSQCRNPFFMAGISLQPPMPQIAYDWTVTSMDAESGGARWDLYIAFIERSDGIRGRVQYNPVLFSDSVIEQMWADLQNLLDGAATYPEADLSTLPPVVANPA